MNRDRLERSTWSVVAPFFFSNGSNQWLDDHVTGERWAFQKIMRAASQDDWHARSSQATRLATWTEYWNQSKGAFPASGVITLFPQLALTAAIQKKLFRSRIPLLAWCFNLGGYPHGWRRAAARAALRSVNRFVVHSTAEVDIVSEFLDLPPGKVEFVPLQRAPIPILACEDADAPFVISMGSANRDYATFFEAAEITKLPCRVVASPRSIDGLRVPANVVVVTGLSHVECHLLVQKSRFSVVPLLDPTIASGQVTVVESMRMNRAVIASESIGTKDYIQSGSTGVLVPPGNPQALATAMLKLWDDLALRRLYAENASAYAEETLSDAAAVRNLTRIMADLESRL